MSFRKLMKLFETFRKIVSGTLDGHSEMWEMTSLHIK